MRRDQVSRILLAVFLLVYVLGGVAYIIYGWETGTGLVGKLMEYQMRIFGAASMRFTVLGVMLVGFLPVVGLVAHLDRKIKASLVTPAAPMSMPAKWALVLGISIFVGLIPSAIYLWLERADAADQQRTVHQLNFRQPGPLAADIKFAEISGYRVLKQQYTFGTKSSSGESRSTTTYVPLVDAEWTPDKPVVYFYTGTILRMPNPLPVRLEAKPMPVFARSKFEQAGIKVAAEHYLLTDAHISGGKVASKIDTYRYVPVLGVILGFFTLFMGGIVIVSHAKAAKKAAMAASFAR